MTRRGFISSGILGHVHGKVTAVSVEFVVVMFKMFQDDFALTALKVETASCPEV